jgi:hypothetical protein
MSYKKITIYAAIILLFVIYLSYTKYVNRKHSNSMNFIIQEYSFIEQNYSYLKNNFLSGIQADLTRLDFDSEIISIKGNNKDFLSFVSSGEKIILYFPKNTCNKCFDFHIKEFLNISDSEDYNNFAILAPVEIIRRTLSEFKDYPKLNIFQKKSSIIELNNITIPCFFTVDERFIIKDFFIPVQNDISLTISYLETLHQRNPRLNN